VKLIALPGKTAQGARNADASQRVQPTGGVAGSLVTQAGAFNDGGFDPGLGQVVGNGTTGCSSPNDYYVCCISHDYSSFPIIWR
jgi:hypothetical protein